MEKIDNKNPMLKVIDSGLMGIHNSHNALSKIWRILLYNTGIRGHQWHTQLSKWQTKLQKNMTEKKATSMKGNITQMLSKPTLSWSGLLTGFNILGYEKLDIKFTLWKHGKAQEINFTITNLSEEQQDENESNYDR